MLVYHFLGSTAELRFPVSNASARREVSPTPWWCCMVLWLRQSESQNFLKASVSLIPNAEDFFLSIKSTTKKLAVLEPTVKKGGNKLLKFWMSSAFV